MTMSVMVHSFVEMTINAESHVQAPTRVAVLAYQATVGKGRAIVIMMVNARALCCAELITVLGMALVQLMTVADSKTKECII